MSQKLQLFIIHCTATPEGRNVTPDEIRQWHLAPLVNADGSVVYKSKTYKSISELPNETIGGVAVPFSFLSGSSPSVSVIKTFSSNENARDHRIGSCCIGQEKYPSWI